LKTSYLDDTYLYCMIKKMKQLVFGCYFTSAYCIIPDQRCLNSSLEIL
jgi:hypothetical protein